MCKSGSEAKSSSWANITLGDSEVPMAMSITIMAFLNVMLCTLENVTKFVL
jgi:hypothetical protein